MDGGVRRLPVAGFSARSGAALLDALIACAVLLIASWTWMFVTNASVGAQEQVVPGYVTATSAALVWLYLTVTVSGGGTLGMRAAKLRVVRVRDASLPGPVKAAARSFVLLGTIWLLIAAHPALLVAYVLLMAMFPARLPHDMAARTAVVGPAFVTATPPTAVASVAPSSAPNLEPVQARALLAELDNLRRRSRADLHFVSPPLIALGALALMGAAVAGLEEGDLIHLALLYWVAAGPVALLVTAWWYRRLRLRNGAGTGESDIILIAILVGCAAIVGTFLSLGGAFTALGFLTLAVTRRSRTLAAAAVLFGSTVELEQFRAVSYGLTNAYPNMPAAHLLDAYGTVVILAGLGASLLVAGSLALRWEHT
ncbi:RDD family protein [Streptomyces sp. NBC_00201]|uniref:RDD family protein n=1 Tax=Streptomyces sp. NBC_00201 TaxID=2975679 RepID=UPI00225C224A|nr:RDD family protein [Streptomyces sp. NBC_00201]MCX5247134.1 RDD family protein [Streptomyces sp. NBC_00201]